METREAHSMIARGVPEMKDAKWVDLGCGSGVFTYALASLLQSGGTIMAIDKSSQRLKKIVGECKIQFVKSDIELESFPFGLMDGILMANSLHYIEDQILFIKKLKQHLKPLGRIILVEYDANQANAWVPYPVAFEKAKTIFSENGFKTINKIGERKSVYRSEMMYACSITQG